MSHSNELDLRILREMGVDVDRRKYEKPLSPASKFRAGALVVIAAIRLRKLEEQWRGVREMGVELGKVKISTSSRSPRVRRSVGLSASGKTTKEV